MVFYTVDVVQKAIMILITDAMNRNNLSRFGFTNTGFLLFVAKTTCVVNW